jgi:hypothetical protein
MTCGANHNKKEEFSNNNLAANAAAAPTNANVITEFWNSSGTAIVVAMVAVLVICLGISILLTVLGHKARVKCIGNPKYGFYSPLIITFLILMWLGNLFPPVTTISTVIGLIGTIVMIVLANDNCKK